MLATCPGRSRGTSSYSVFVQTRPSIAAATPATVTGSPITGTMSARSIH